MPKPSREALAERIKRVARERALFGHDGIDVMFDMTPTSDSEMANFCTKPMRTLSVILSKEKSMIERILEDTTIWAKTMLGK